MTEPRLQELGSLWDTPAHRERYRKVLRREMTLEQAIREEPSLPRPLDSANTPWQTVGMERTYHDKTGKPLTQNEWAKLYETSGYRDVARTRIDEALVSTMWHGGYGDDDPDGRPLIFETLVDSKLTEWSWTRQTATLADAKAMHKAAVAWVKRKAPQPDIRADELASAQETFREMAAKLEEARERRYRIVRDAAASGWTHARIAEATGLTRARVGQITLTGEA